MQSLNIKDTQTAKSRTFGVKIAQFPTTLIQSQQGTVTRYNNSAGTSLFYLFIYIFGKLKWGHTKVTYKKAEL